MLTEFEPEAMPRKEVRESSVTMTSTKPAEPAFGPMVGGTLTAILGPPDSAVRPFFTAAAWAALCALETEPLYR